MTKGLKIASVSIVEFCRDATTRFMATPMNTTDQIAALQGGSMVYASIGRCRAVV
jgi:hypothetical protein